MVILISAQSGAGLRAEDSIRRTGIVTPRIKRHLNLPHETRVGGGQRRRVRGIFRVKIRSGIDPKIVHHPRTAVPMKAMMVPGMLMAAIPTPRHVRRGVDVPRTSPR